MTRKFAYYNTKTHQMVDAEAPSTYSIIPNRLLNPYALKGNKGEIKYGQYGKNLFDPANAVLGRYDDSGNAVSDNSCKRTNELIEVKSNTNYYFSSTGEYQSNVIRIIAFDSSKTFISLLKKVQGNSVDLTTPANCKYIGISFASTLTNIQLEEGSSATPYEPYHFGLHADGSHKIFIGEQGVVDLGSLSYSIGTDETFPYFKATLQDKKVAVGEDGVKMFVDGFNMATSTGSASLRLQDNTFGASGSSSQLFIRCEKYGSAAEFKAAMSGKYIFYQRTTDVTYIPPIQTEITDLLYSPDDYVDIQAGKLGHSWGVKVLDGVTNGLKFTRVSTLSTFYYSSISQDGMTPTMSVSCTHFKNRNVVENGVCYGGSNNITFHHPFSTVEEANAWLASEYAKGTPVIVIYPLATPTETTITTTPISLVTKGSKTITSSAEIPVSVQAKVLSK